MALDPTPAPVRFTKPLHVLLDLRTHDELRELGQEMSPPMTLAEVTRSALREWIRSHRDAAA